MQHDVGRKNRDPTATQRTVAVSEILECLQEWVRIYAVARRFLAGQRENPLPDREQTTPSFSAATRRVSLSANRLPGLRTRKREPELQDEL